MLNPFRRSPHAILGLPVFASKSEITNKWKMLVGVEVADGTDGSEISTTRTKLLNRAKDRALAAYDTPPVRYAKMSKPQDDTEVKEECAEAEADRVEYEMLWMDQMDAGRWREKNDAMLKAGRAEIEATLKKERAAMEAILNAGRAEIETTLKTERTAMEAILKVERAGMKAAEEEARAKRVRADKNATENAVMQKKPRAAHKKVWDGDEFARLEKLIGEFVRDNTEERSEVFTSVQEFLSEFKNMHHMEDVNANFFSRKLKEAVEEVFPDVPSVRRSHMGEYVKGYAGIRVCNATVEKSAV